MATVNGSLVDVISTSGGFAYSDKGRFVTVGGYGAELGGTTSAKTFYKMQAVDPTEASGYATWLNTTGDDTGKPGTATGASVRVASWLG